MNTPLNEEQIKRVNEISQLPPERQQQELSEFLKTLTPEQVEFLKKQQSGQKGGQCPFCLMVEGKIAVNKVYEDNFCLGILDINPAAKGHVILFPKMHYESLSDVKDVSGLFNVANKISSILLRIGAEGTNIFVANGAVAGQTGPHVLIHIIPRYTNDGINFGWNPTKMDESEMKVIAEKIKKNISAEDELLSSTENEMKKIIYSEKERTG